MSIEALNWARKIYVGDSLAKSLLRAIADYADEHGHAWPSHSRLAADCEMSESTVKRRIAQLEEIGLVVTFRCWIDDLGRRNREQRGRETSRDIVLALGTMRDPPAATSETTDGGPDEGGGSDSTPSSGVEGVPAAPHGVQRDPPGGSHVTTPNEPSLNQKDSPQTPQVGGGCLEGEARKLFEYFLHNCLGWRTQANQERIVAMFAALSEADQIACAAASPVHAAECTKLKKKSQDAWKLIRDSYWTRYPEARMPERKPDPVWISDPGDLAALRLLAVITDRPPPRTIDDPERGTGFWRAMPVTPDLLALASGDAVDVLDWFVAEPETREFNAWRHRLHDWTGQWVEPRLVMRRGTHTIQLPGQQPFEAQNRTQGIPVPWPFPPRKDGTIRGDEDSNESSR
jgi:hypothetical protein